jgi:Leucine-rich repeat (LRR) protein
MIAGIKFEEGKYGRRAVLTSDWSYQMAKDLKDHGIVELELNMAKGWRGNDLSFLSELPHLQSFEILDLRPSIQNIEPIHFLHELRKLGISTYCSTEIQFSAFPKLEDCSLEWGKRKAQSLFDCKSLKKLFVNRYKGNDIEPFTRLTELESLTIYTAPIVSLQGIERLQKLRRLSIALFRKLASLTGIQGLTQLEELEISTCRSFHSIVEVGYLTHLRKLILANCGDIDSFKPLEKLSNLEEVIFYESTNVIDGDLSQLMQLKKLSNVTFQNRRHYSHRREEFAAY